MKQVLLFIVITLTVNAILSLKMPDRKCKTVLVIEYYRHGQLVHADSMLASAVVDNSVAYCNEHRKSIKKDSLVFSLR